MNKLLKDSKPYRYRLVGILFLLIGATQQVLYCTQEKALVFHLFDKTKHEIYIVDKGENVKWFNRDDNYNGIKVDKRIKNLASLTTILEWDRASSQCYYNIKESAYIQYNSLNIKNQHDIDSTLQLLYKKDKKRVLKDLREVFLKVLENDIRRKKEHLDLELGDIVEDDVNEHSIQLQEPYNYEKKLRENFEAFKSGKEIVSTNFYIPIVLKAVRLERTEEAGIKKDVSVSHNDFESKNKKQESAQIQDQAGIIKKIKQAIDRAIQKKKELEIQESQMQKKNKKKQEASENEMQQLKQSVDNLKKTQKSTKNDDQPQKEKEDLEKKIQGSQVTLIVEVVVFLGILVISHLLLHGETLKQLFRRKNSEAIS